MDIGQLNHCKKLFSKSPLFLLILSILVFAFTRLHHLTILPIFNDEAFYLHWAQIIHNDPSALWLPAVDGKTPLFYWVTALVIGFFNNPLVSGRLVSVSSGFITLLLLYRIGKALSYPLAGAISSSVYALLPFAFINDRLASVDSFHTMLVIFVLHASILFSKKRLGIKSPIYLGLALSAAFLAKTPTLLFFPFPIMTGLFLKNERINKEIMGKISISYFMLASTIALYLTRDVQMIGADGSKIFHRGRFFLSARQFISFPVHAWLDNLSDLASYIKFYYSLPLLALLIFVAGFAFVKKNRDILLLLSWSLLPLILLILITKETFSRYYLAPLTLSIPALGYGAVEILKNVENSDKKLRFSISLVVITLILFFSIQSTAFVVDFLRNPSTTPLVKRDRWQYIEGYPSGYGLKEIIEYLNKRAEGNKRIVVFTTMNWGNPADAVKIYFSKSKNVLVLECWWWELVPVMASESKLPIINDKFRRQIIREISVSDFNEFYFVTGSHPFSKDKFAKLNPEADLVMETEKPGGISWFLLYRLK